MEEEHKCLLISRKSLSDMFSINNGLKGEKL